MRERLALTEREYMDIIARKTAALGPGDTPAQHERDTLVAGAGACDLDAVRVLVSEFRLQAAFESRSRVPPLGEVFAP